MTARVSFWSYFRDHTGCPEMSLTLPDGTTLGGLHEEIIRRCPALGPYKKSTLMAVGVEYQPVDHVLKDGDCVALFPPVQGG